MKAKVKPDHSGFINGNYVRGGQVIEIEPKKHSILKNDKNKPLTITAEEQFSDIWMERVKPGPSKRVSELQPSEAVTGE